MSSMQTRSAPSAGIKVSAGKNAPVIQEAAGRVHIDSLAAESYREDGKFAENRDAEPDTSSYTASSFKGDLFPQASSVPRGGSTAQGGAAPTYVNNQYISDENSPHGKNLQRGFSDRDTKDGIQVAFNSEPGSINDPGRLAESQFERSDAENPRLGNAKDTALRIGTAYDGVDNEIHA